ncbi:MAG: protein phosphatase, partial [Actinomycetota bacterium]|nr:protein phosphatase [Actinomycetota bacterium]
FMVGLLVLVLLAAGAVVARIWVNTQYFVGSGESGEVAIFQGVRGSVLGLSLNSQLEGSCAPAEAATCDKFFVDDLEQFGKDEVRSGSNTFDNIVAARAFVSELRKKFGLPNCDELVPTPTPGTSAPPEPGQPPGGVAQPTTAPPVATSPVQPTESAAPTTTKEAPQPGLNCRKPRDEDKDGG